MSLNKTSRARAFELLFHSRQVITCSAGKAVDHSACCLLSMSTSERVKDTDEQVDRHSRRFLIPWNFIPKNRFLSLSCMNKLFNSQTLYRYSNRTIITTRSIIPTVLYMHSTYLYSLNQSRCSLPTVPLTPTVPLSNLSRSSPLIPDLSSSSIRSGATSKLLFTSQFDAPPPPDLDPEKRYGSDGTPRYRRVSW